MADFCKDCSLKMFGEDFRELAGLCKEDECCVALCEGCGFIYVDFEGKKIEETEMAIKTTMTT